MGGVGVGVSEVIFTLFILCSKWPNSSRNTKIFFYFDTFPYWAEEYPDIEDKPDKIEEASEPVLNDEVLKAET